MTCASRVSGRYRVCDEPRPGPLRPAPADCIAPPARTGDHLHAGIQQHRARFARPYRRAAPDRRADAAGAADAAMRPLPMYSKTLERWSPWLLLLGTTVLWQIICSVFEVSESIFPSPWAIATQLAEFGSVIARHASRTLCVTLARFCLAILL